MIYDLATLVETPAEELGDEVTVRCRIQSNRIPGTESNGLKSIYIVDDARQAIEEDVAVSFWSSEPLEEPLQNIISKTEDYVLDALGLPMELEEGTGTPLQRGEELLVRASPNRSEGSEADLYLNVTSLAIREPTQLISKSQLRTQDNCPRENYLRYVKNVYTGDRYSQPPYQRGSRFQGIAVHRITELAVEQEFDRFADGTWEEETIKSFCNEIFEEEFGFRQALLVLSGAGLTVKEYAIENVKTLFINEEFVSILTKADEVTAEEFLDEEYGYAGRVDLLVDGVPYDIKTTRNPDEQTIEGHSYQVRLYLFALLLQSIEDGASIPDVIDTGLEGALVYPNLGSGDVRIEPVTLSLDDVAEFIRVRNEAVIAGDTFAPPSPYNRDCKGCQFAVDEWISGPDDALPPACTYHCQNERRWPCYELEDGEFRTDCSRFDDCEQRLTYRDTSEVAYYERTRAGFQAEQRARRTATQVLEQFDADLLASAGYAIPSLHCVGAKAAGTVLRFTSDAPTVPSFEAGETVRIRNNDSELSFRATYIGEHDGEFLFKIESRGVSLGDVLTANGPFTATYRFSTESVERKFLPYLDFAQRRGVTAGFAKTTIADGGAPSIDAPAAIVDHLDREEVFVDVPVQRSRSQTVGELVETLVSSPYPIPDDHNNQIPEEASRALVLGTTPHLVECAVQAQPTGEHYRLDGTGGGDDAIEEEDSYHEIQTRLGNARSLVSSTQLVMSKNGPGGVREFFHKLEEGDFKEDDDPSKRSHSEKFFDLVVVLGGERLTEPEYHFLSDLADRTVVVGDTRRHGPRMVSSEASETGLDQSYFGQAFEHYRSFPSDSAASLQLDGEAPPALGLFYPDGPWDEIDGTLEFLSTEGVEETAQDVVELTTTVRAEHSARRLVFDVTDTPVSPIEAQELFQERLALDATKLQEGSVVLIDNISLFLREVSDIGGENTNSHEVVIQADAAELPQFGRGLLSNRAAERIIVQAVQERDIDVVVTPFERHAANIKRNLTEAGIDVPVRRPEALTGDLEQHALVSFAVANDTHVVRPPLDDPEVLYELLSSGVDLTLVGHAPTLSTKDLFDSLIEDSVDYGA